MRTNRQTNEQTNRPAFKDRSKTFRWLITTKSNYLELRNLRTKLKTGSQVNSIKAPGNHINCIISFCGGKEKIMIDFFLCKTYTSTNSKLLRGGLLCSRQQRKLNVDQYLLLHLIDRTINFFLWVLILLFKYGLWLQSFVLYILCGMLDQIAVLKCVKWEYKVFTNSTFCCSFMGEGGFTRKLITD